MFIKTQAPQDALIDQLLPIMTQACAILREEYQNYCAGQAFDVEHKSDDSPVTQADFRVNHYLTEQLRLISDLPLLSEEGEQTERSTWSKFWLLDPLDGTKEFLHQRAQFTINLSLIEGAHTVFAILAVPEEHTLYICPKVGMPLKYDTQVKTWFGYVAQATHKDVQIGISHSRQQKAQYQAFFAALEQLNPYTTFQAGSAYKFCMMLEDKIDIYPRFHPTSEWDTSAGQCLLERIGGGLIDLSGRAFVYNQRATLLNGGFLAYRNDQMKRLALQALGRMSNMH